MGSVIVYMGLRTSVVQPMDVIPGKETISQIVRADVRLQSQGDRTLQHDENVLRSWTQCCRRLFMKNLHACDGHLTRLNTHMGRTTADIQDVLVHSFVVFLPD